MFVQQRSWVILLIQVVLVTASVTAAWLLRFDFHMSHYEVLFSTLPILLLMRIAGITRFNLLHGYWRYTGISDVADIIKAVGAGSLGFYVIVRWVLGVSAFPLSVYVIEAVLTTLILGGVRAFSRALMQTLEGHHHAVQKRSVLIVGAGAAAAMLLPELKRAGYLPVGMVDDDGAKLGVRLHGVPVLGPVTDLPRLAQAHDPEEILIAVPSATGAQMRRISDYCQQTQKRFRTIPGLAELIEGRVTVEQLRDVSLDDLLGREPVKLDLEHVAQRLQGRVVMVTGAAGSIGAELCRQILKYRPAKLICVDQAETPLFYLQLATATVGTACVYYVADITDTDRMRAILSDEKATAIFHAAAYKHVPLMEVNLGEALKNNVFGLMELLKVADECGCADFLSISSDKAVHPSSFMGCTKRLGELLLAARQPCRMRCLSVRFGNVLGSQGSVIPVFQQQIRTDRRITVTHPEVTRYFMTIPEAVALVLQAFAVGEPGDILVLDMGEPVRIVDMARTLIKLSGLSEDEVTIVYTGLRPGEKLYEELFYRSERSLPTSAIKVRRARGPKPVWAELKHGLDATRLAALSGDDDLIRARVRQIIPEYLWAPAEEPTVTARSRALAATAAGAHD
jgi:FlaA1/EpsC-like NDP-sugar epimerase